MPTSEFHCYIFWILYLLYCPIWLSHGRHRSPSPGKTNCDKSRAFQSTNYFLTLIEMLQVVCQGDVFPPHIYIHACSRLAHRTSVIRFIRRTTVTELITLGLKRRRLLCVTWIRTPSLSILEASVFTTRSHHRLQIMHTLNTCRLVYRNCVWPQSCECNVSYYQIVFFLLFILQTIV